MGGLIQNVAAAVIGGNRTNRGISEAADAQAAASREAINLQRDIYNQNVGFQTPLYNTGIGAMNQMNALLGIQSQNYAGQAMNGGNGVGGGQSEDEWATGALNALRSEVNQSLWSQVNGIEDPSDRLRALEPLMFRRDREAYGEYTSTNPRPLNSGNGAGNVTGNPQPVSNGTNPDGTPQTAQQAAEAAYNVFRNSTGYQSRLTEANNSMNSAYAARGTMQSGAAQIGMARMNQDYAANEFGQYYNMLGGQQQLASGAANALGGVGTNYANQAGNIGMQQGNNIANSAIARANNSNNTLGSINSSFNQAAQLPFSIMGSDRRLKKDIVLIGTRSDGLNLYEWTYRNDADGERQRGFMADEVHGVYPAAYVEDFDGLGHAGVNYGAIPREVAA